MDSAVAELIGLENLTCETHSLDDDYPEQLVWLMGQWLATAHMVWREWEAPVVWV